MQFYMLCLKITRWPGGDNRPSEEFLKCLFGSEFAAIGLVFGFGKPVGTRSRRNILV